MRFAPRRAQPDTRIGVGTLSNYGCRVIRGCVVDHNDLMVVAHTFFEPVEHRQNRFGFVECGNNDGELHHSIRGYDDDRVSEIVLSDEARTLLRREIWMNEHRRS